MELQQIKYILAIAEEKNITKAAEKMFVSQSAMSQQLLKLETELGTPLFDRSGKALEITEAGRIYVSTAVAIFNIEKSFLQEEEQFSKSTPKTRIVVSTEVPVFVADKMITGIRKKRDMGNVTVFYARQDDNLQLHKLLLENRADIVIGNAEGGCDSGMEILVQESEQFCFLFYGEKTHDEIIEVWLSPEMWQRRRLEEEALRDAGVKVAITGTCELPLHEAIQRTSTGMFIAKSQFGKNVRGGRPLAGFTQRFSARCIKKSE